MNIEQKLKELKIEIPQGYMAIANYVPASRDGNILYLAGTGPSRGKEPLYRGKLGAEVSIEEGYQAARTAAVNVLAILKQELGDLERVDRILKMTGYVNCTADFEKQPAVLDGASDLFVEVFGERGRHARAAVGVNALPMSLPVEIEVTVRCKS